MEHVYGKQITLIEMIEDVEKELSNGETQEENSEGNKRGEES